MADRFGLGWRPELAAGIWSSLDRIDVVEVIADDHFQAADRELRALRTLGAAVPVVLHGVSMGLASASPVPEDRLRGMARVAHAVQPELWSEHLAFVRAGGREIGHLAAPPRNEATLRGTLRNLERAAAVVGTRPALENVASLIDPPGCDRSEPAFLAAVLQQADAPLLLDLHNLHANAVNFGFDARAWLDAVPLERVRVVHLAGGQWTGARDGGAPRWLDDHRHAVPDPVFALLEEVACRAPQALTVVLERDGAYPPMASLLQELDAARAAVRRGRARGPEPAGPAARAAKAGDPLAPAGVEGLEALLAHAYSDGEAMGALLADPEGVARAAGVAPEAVRGLDRRGLVLAGRSYAQKRADRMAVSRR